MEKVRLNVIIDLVKENPNLLSGIKDAEIRGNKKIILAACKTDHTAVRLATVDLRKNAAFVFKTQGKNPEKLLRLVDLYPSKKYEWDMEKIENLIYLSNNPFEFASMPTEYFKDKEYISACKDCVAFNIERKIKHRKDKKCELTEDDVLQATDLLNLVEDKIKLENTAIALENQKSKKTSSLKLKQIAKDITKR